MATNSVTWTGSYGQYSRLYIELTLASQSVANNTSTFSYKVRGQSTDVNASIYWTSGSLQLSNAYSKTKAIGSGSFNYTTEFVFDSGTFTVSHNADGTLSARTLTANVTLSSGHNATVSVSLTVPTIPRASQPSLNVSTQALGSSITISTNRASSSFTHTLTYSFGNQSGTIATGVATSQAWTLPIGLASAIPNSLSGVGTITCKTFNGSTEIGSKSVSFTATVPNNATFQPTATINSIVQGTTLPSGITVFVQNQSKAKVTSSGTGKYNSTIKTYSVAVAGIGTYTGSVITSDTLRNSGSVRVTLTVTDSRGLKGSTYQDINVVDYSPPQLLTFNAQRSESTPVIISANYNASISPVNNQNNKYFRIRSKASDGSWVTETSNTQNYTFSGTQTIVSDPDKSYTIEFFVQDAFTSITQTVQVGTAFTLVNFNASGKGMAISKVSESDSFEVGMPAIFHKGIKNLYGRTTSANLAVTGDSSVKHFLATSSMTEGRPTKDGYITHYEWDTVGGWSSQLYVPNDIARPTMGFRIMTSGTWSKWYDIWSTSNSNAMTESGSNSNGHYIRFSDGTQICWHTVSFPATFVAWGTLYEYRHDTKITFPAAFVSKPSIGVTTSGANAAMIAKYRGDATGITFVSLVRPTIINGTYYIDYVAIGRWK